MSWQASFSTLTARYGNLAQKVVTLVAKTLLPGAGVVVDLLESGFEVVKTVAKDQQEAALLAKTRANLQDLERLGELLGHLTGDMAKVCAKAETLIEEDLPGKVQGAVLRALQEDPALMLAQRKMEQVCRQMSRIEEQNSHLIKGMEDMQLLVGRIGGVADYADDMKKAGVNGQFFIEAMQKIMALLELIHKGQIEQAMAKLRTLPPEMQAMPSVLTLEAGARVVVQEYDEAATLLQKASRLKPNDTELGDLSRAATHISFLAKDSKPDFLSLTSLKRFETGDIIDGFALTARLGSGGWGQVFRATRDGQTKALKIIHPELSQNRGVLDRFKAEIRTLMRLPVHPNLVRIEEFGYCTTQKCWYLVMEYIDGPTLGHYLKTNGALSPTLAKKVFQPVANGLGTAHAIGIVHRDIKPGNMVFRRADKNLVLIDFGMANDSNDSGKAQVDGKTVFFAAPEQLRGRSADARSDVFSLAATMHFALEYADRERREPESFSAAKAPSELRNAMVRSMAFNPSERFAHAGELALALETIDRTTKKMSDYLESLTAIIGAQSIDILAANTPKTEVPLCIGNTLDVPITSSIKMTFAWVPPGQSWLAYGGGPERTDSFTLEKGLWCGIYPVTQAQWQALMGNNPSCFNTRPNHPVEQVSWNDVQQFLQKMNAANSRSGFLYRLPTTDEWRYIIRGGPIPESQSRYEFYFARSKTDLTAVASNDLSSTQANFNGNYPEGNGKKGPYLESTSAVGNYLPNPLGIYDMHGNVWEWTSTYIYDDYECDDDDHNSDGGSFRTACGGSWADNGGCSASSTEYLEPDYCVSFVGFRLLAVSIEG